LRGGHRIVVFSCVLFTVSLVCMLPLSWSRIWSDDSLAQAAGLGSLTIILVGLIVTWMGFARRVRWSWLVMFIIVGAWALPIFVWPTLAHIVSGHVTGSFSEWMSDAWQRRGIPRIVILNALLVSMMVIALLLPIKSFFFVREPSVGAVQDH
jgi:hypothetical protein